MIGNNRLAYLVVLCLIFLHACTTVSEQSSSEQISVENFLSEMTDQDLEFANQTVQKALENLVSNKFLDWQNPENNHSGNVSPLRTYQTKDGIFCRVYAETIVLDDKTRRVEGTACRNDEGVWQPI